jgi:hypothetical protein
VLSPEQHPDQASRRCRFPTEWALDYGDKEVPVQRTQQSESACPEVRMPDRPRAHKEQLDVRSYEYHD